MKWILFMTLLYRGAALDHMEFRLQADCERMAAKWVASQPKTSYATAFCEPKHVKEPGVAPKAEGLK